MTQGSTETIREAARTGLGVVRTQDLRDADPGEFGWQRLAPTNDTSYAGQDINGAGGRIEVALGRPGTPHGEDIVLVRSTANPDLVHVYEKASYEELVAGIISGQFRMPE